MKNFKHVIYEYRDVGAEPIVVREFWVHTSFGRQALKRFRAYGMANAFFKRVKNTSIAGFNLMHNDGRVIELR